MSWFSKSVKSDRDADQELLERYLATGDLKLLGELFRTHSSMVYYVCYRYFQDTERSKDAVMQIFEQLIDKVGKHDVRQFASWLYVLTKNYCLMQIRSDKKMQYVSFDEFVEFPMDQHQVDHKEKEKTLTALEACIERLPERQKQSINLFFLDEKCYKEIVSLTGFSLNEVKSYIQNGKRNLKNCIERSGSEQ